MSSGVASDDAEPHCANVAKSEHGVSLACWYAFSQENTGMLPPAPGHKLERHPLSKHIVLASVIA